MKQKWIAVLTAAVFMVLAAVGCAKGEQVDAENPDAYRNRFEAAAVSRQLDSVEGVTSGHILETEGNVLVSVDYPVIADAPDISAEMKTFVEEKLAEFRTAAKAASTENKSGPSSLMVTYKPYRTEGGLLSIKFTTKSKLASQETSEEVDAFVYDTTTNKKLGLTDVFDSTQDYLTSIAQEAQACLRNNEVLRKHADEDQIAEGAAPSEEKYEDFVLAPDKVLFFFNRGTILPSEAGSFAVGIPFTKLAGVLNEGNKEAILGTEQEGAMQDVHGAAHAGPAETDIRQIRARDGFMTAKSIEGIDPMGDKVIAITFDDGPHETLTPKLLDILEENGVVATFFMLGQNAEKYPDIVKRAYDEGHEIGTHSWDHRDSWPKLSTDDRLDQYTKANDAIQAATGLRTLIDRPPYGAMQEEMAAQIGREQIIWSVDPEDWKYRDADEVYDRVIDGTDNGGYVRDGGIILSHDIHATTVEAFARIIPKLKDEGYTFVTVTQLMQIAEARGQDMGEYKFFSAPTAADASKNE